MARHGPMVLSVCRGILKDPNDAEDAFQATFLILVKKSGDAPQATRPWGPGSIRWPTAWRSGPMPPPPGGGHAKGGRDRWLRRPQRSGPAAPDEPLQALHEEIARLPEKFRRAVILCDLERMPQARAAGELR